MTEREKLTEKIKRARRSAQLSWRALAAEISDSSAVIVTAALLGQMTLTAEEAGKAAKLLDLNDDEKALLQESPYRGSIPALPPTDPLIYRFYELLQVYGTTFKELIQEEFGDGIMSAIDFSMALEREPDPKGDRVRITMSGKFLPYKRY